MATFKPTVRGERKDGFLQVYIRVTHRRVYGYIKTDKVVKDMFGGWNDEDAYMKAM